jgi:hypothetical protein
MTCDWFKPAFVGCMSLMHMPSPLRLTPCKCWECIAHSKFVLEASIIIK